MRVRYGSPTVFSIVVVVLFVLALSPSLVLGQTGASLRDQCTPILDAEIQAKAASTTPGLASFPVVVHYMKHVDEASGPDSKARAAFPLDDVKKFFRVNGEFNKVWGATDPKVTFVLVGVETCTFKLGDGTSPPAVDNLMERIGEAYNMPSVVLANVRQDFKGLNLYLWENIEGEVGGFARSTAAIPKPSVWLAPDCVRGRFCDSKFAHEVGHFFGLCHVCTNVKPPESETNPSTCRQTCPAQGQANQRLLACEDNAPELMADRFGTKLQPCERSFAVDNAKRILTPAVH
jgi:hypothetical protein